MFPADDAQFFAVPVVCKRLDHVGARPPEFTMQPGHDIGMLEYDLRHVWSRLQIPPALEFKQVPLGAYHRVFVKPLQQAPGVFRCTFVHRDESFVFPRLIIGIIPLPVALGRDLPARSGRRAYPETGESRYR